MFWTRAIPDDFSGFGSGFGQVWGQSGQPGTRESNPKPGKSLPDRRILIRNPGLAHRVHVFERFFQDLYQKLQNSTGLKWYWCSTRRPCLLLNFPPRHANSYWSSSSTPTQRLYHLWLFFTSTTKTFLPHCLRRRRWYLHPFERRPPTPPRLMRSMGILGSNALQHSKMFHIWYS